MRIVCPVCKGPLEASENEFRCAACARVFPVICGIPDFRLAPDPYIGIEEDREKGLMLLAHGEGRNSQEMFDLYYSITPEVPPSLARKYLRHSLAQVVIAGFQLRSSGLLAEGQPNRGALLDVGCSTGGLLAAAASGYEAIVGVDVAFRWLLIASIRLRELGVRATLLCANAEALPLAPGQFRAVTMIDTLEHVRDAAAALREAHRVSLPGGRVLCITNNRYSPVPEPHVGLWGVGYLPRSWQAPYVAWRRNNLKEYRVSMRSAWELERLLRDAGYLRAVTDGAPLCAPHLENPRTQRLLSWHNRFQKQWGGSVPWKFLTPSLRALAEVEWTT